MYTVHNTADWSLSQLKKYGRDILKSLEKIAQKYPDEISLDSLSKEILTGKRQLWLILKDKEFSAFLTTALETTFSGKKRLMLLELAGEGGINLVPLLKTIEDYAIRHGVQEICPIGRCGWTKAMREAGYKPEIVKFKKEIKSGTIF